VKVNKVMNEWYAENAPLVGKKCHEVYHNARHPCDPCPSLRCLRSGKTEMNVVPGLPGSAAEWLELFSYPMIDPETGEVTGVIEFVRDITDRKRAEKEREKLEGQLRHMQKMEAIGRLAGGMAHDFNNMLGVIKGYSELALERLRPSDPLRQDIEQITRAADKSAALTRQLLAFSRQQIISPRIVDLNVVIRDAQKMLERLIGEEIEFRFIASDNLWTIEMDPMQIEEILVNLAVNSRDAISENGEIVIETSNVRFDDALAMTHPGASPGEYVSLAFSDNGCGMDAETKARIFDPYFTTKEKGRGTGLVMSMVYGIVKQNEGFIYVYSEPGHGTTIRMYFPHREGEVAAEQNSSGETRSIKGDETLLVVEDEEQVLDIAKLALERQGYTVLAAAHPGEAILLAEQHEGKIDMLVTDVMMPKMNAKELVKRINAIKPGIKVLYMSGYTANVIAHRGILDADAHFIHKPFSPLELAAKVRQTLDEA